MKNARKIPLHTPGPITVDDAHIHAKCLVYRDDRWLLDGTDIVCEIDLSGRKDELLTDTDKANLRRIAAAWNACIDIPTESLEGGLITSLISACNAVVSSWESGDLAAAARQCAEAIAKAGKK